MWGFLIKGIAGGVDAGVSLSFIRARHESSVITVFLFFFQVSLHFQKAFVPNGRSRLGS